MSKRNRTIATGAAIAALAGGGAAVAIAGGGGDDDGPGDSEKSISGSALGKAGAAALAHTGGGTVTETEVGDEESYYEVEVRLDDGSQTDVQLDRGFNVVGDEADGPNEDESGDG